MAQRLSGSSPNSVFHPPAIRPGPALASELPANAAGHGLNGGEAGLERRRASRWR